MARSSTILDASRSCLRLTRGPFLRVSQSVFGEVPQDSLRKHLCRRSLVSSLESRICENASTREVGSVDPKVEKSSCATPRPVRMTKRSLLMVLRSLLASRRRRAKLLMSGITWGPGVSWSSGASKPRSLPVRWKCSTQHIWRQLCLNACLVVRWGFEGRLLINKSKAEKARGETSTRAATRASRQDRKQIGDTGRGCGRGGEGSGLARLGAMRWRPVCLRNPCNDAAQV
jgi:hypothetical protein